MNDVDKNKHVKFVSPHLVSANLSDQKQKTNFREEPQVAAFFYLQFVFLSLLCCVRFLGTHRNCISSSYSWKIYSWKTENNCQR